MRRRSLVFVALVLALPSLSVRAQQVRDTAAERIHRLVLAQDYEAAIGAGKELARRGAASPEARAWTISALSSYGLRGTAQTDARALKRSRPADPWADYALFVVGDSPLIAMRRAREKAPWQPVFVGAYATALLRSTPGIRMDPRPALAVLDSAVARSGASAELWQARATVEQSAIYVNMKPDTLAAGRALAASDSALRLDSTRMDAWATRIHLLSLLGSPGRALEAAHRAVALQPTSTGAHKLLWDLIVGRRSDPPARRGEEIAADFEALARTRGRTPGLLLAASRAYGDLELESLRQPLAAELRRDHPGSWELEQVELDDIRELDSRTNGRHPDSAAAHAQLLRAVRAFTAQPGRSAQSLGRAYDIELNQLAGDSTAPLPDLARATAGAVRYGESWRVQTTLLLLAEHAETRAVARRLASRLPAFLDAQNGRISIVGDTTAALRQRREQEWQRNHQAAMHDLLGWIALNEGHDQTAARELTLARKLNPLSDETAVHLGRLEERRGRLDEAVKLYVGAYASDRFSRGRPAEMGLKRVFARQDSTPGAFDRLLERRAAEQQARQLAGKEAVRKRILARRLAEPRPLPTLDLARLEGGRFTSVDLRGRVAVVNFWGTWCSPCVEELPAIQKLHERYRNDPDVLVVTIDDEHDAPDPRKLVGDFMTARKLTFPVLLADSSVTRLVTAWPTTWFIDRRGRIAYEQTGSPTRETGDPVEPFVWQVESLRDSSAAPAPTAARDTNTAPKKAAPPAGAQPVR